MPSRRGRSSHTRRYPRTARLNEVLREIDADGSEDEVFERASAALADLRGGASSAEASRGARP